VVQDFQVNKIFNQDVAVVPFSIQWLQQLQKV
jgi:hypothetical protein